MKNKIAIILPYKSPHVMPFVEALFDLGVDIVIGIEQPFHKYRPYLVEQEYPNLPIINLLEDRESFFIKVKDFSIGISLGIFHSKEVIRFANYFTKKDRSFYLISETEHGLKKSKLKKFLKRSISFLINKKNFYLLAIGGKDCFNYYKSIGLKPRMAYNFGYFTYKTFKLVEIEKNKNSLLNLITVSQLIERKNIHYLLKAIKNLDSKEQKSIRLTIIGDGILKYELIRFAEKLECDITFTGNISNNTLILSKMKAHDFLVLSSLFDGWGAVVNEGISMGLGLLLSNKVYASKELLKQNENGFSFDIDNTNELTIILRNLIYLGGNYYKFKNNSLEIANYWSGEIAAERFLKLMNNETQESWNEGPFSKTYN